MHSYLLKIKLALFIFLLSTSLQAERVKIVQAPKSITEGAPDTSLFVFEDFKKNQELTVWFRRAIQPDPTHYQMEGKFKLNEEGHLTIDPKKGIYLLPPPCFYALGEVSYWTFLNQENQKVAEITYNPRPFYQLSKQGTFTVKALLLTGDPTIYQLIIEGFDLNEAYDFYTLINQTARDYKRIYKPNNIITVCLEEKGKEGGVSYVRLTRKTGDSITLKLNWGKAILKEMAQEMSKSLELGKKNNPSGLLYLI